LNAQPAPPNRRPRRPQPASCRLSSRRMCQRSLQRTILPSCRQGRLLIRRLSRRQRIRRRRQLRGPQTFLHFCPRPLGPRTLPRSRLWSRRSSHRSTRPFILRNTRPSSRRSRHPGTPRHCRPLTPRRTQQTRRPLSPRAIPQCCRRVSRRASQRCRRRASPRSSQLHCQRACPRCTRAGNRRLRRRGIQRWIQRRPKPRRAIPDFWARRAACLKQVKHILVG